MSRLLIKGAEAALGTNTAGANAFSNARLVRVVNTTSNAHLVTLVATVGGSTVGSFTLPGGAVVQLEKEPLQGIFAANAGVKGAAVGYTN
jgi:hypothetical protein|tara:strand:+ start:1142 stop:1411 length:270 start_codon:yes stop_codon:yes gene_type:complete